MNQVDLKKRTQRFALEIIRRVDHLPSNVAGKAIAAQPVRCATSVGANYRAACRSRSESECIARIGVVEEEADESVWWLELRAEIETLPPSELQPLPQEANELAAIFTATGRTAKRNARAKSGIRNPKSEIQVCR